MVCKAGRQSANDGQRLEQLGVVVAVRGRTRAQEHEQLATRVFEAMGNAWGNAHRVTGANLKTLVPERHHAFARGEVVDLFGRRVAMQRRSSARPNRRLGEALPRVAMHGWVHQLPDL